MKRLTAMVLLFVMSCASVYADSIGVRGAVAQNNADEDFEVYELFVVFDLPWAWDRGGHRIQTQLEILGGAMIAADETGSLGAIGPRLAFETGRASVDLGVGVAAVGRREFGEQDFGGAAQFIAHIGLAFSVTERLNVGVRYRHMSDGETHENGEDINLVMLEMSFDFNEQ